ncbi:MAG TPA: hypothetical protein VGN52_23810 [Burkholderiales bacterium]
MAELNDSNLPTAAYITFVQGTALPPGTNPAETLQERLRNFSGLPVAEMSMDVGGAGLLLGFSHPTRTLAFARALAALAHSSAWDLPAVRIGVHVASVVNSAPGESTTLSGSSIDGAVRIAGLAEANQALATAQFQTVLVRLLKLDGNALKPLGKRTTASGKTLDVFEVVVEGAAPAVQAAPAARSAAPAPQGLDADHLAQIEEALATEIGPIARILMKQAAGLLPDQHRFLIRLADAVPEPDRRRAFLSKATQIAGG